MATCETNIPQTDNTPLPCDDYVNDICVTIHEGYPFINSNDNESLKEVLEKIIEKMIAINGGDTNQYDIALNGNNLELSVDNTLVTSLDLSQFLDNTNLARITSADYTGTTLTLTRGDASTITAEIITVNPTGLEAIDEGNGTGWRLIGKNPTNYGNTGSNSVDFSHSISSSTTNGATGNNSFAAGYNTEASGNNSTAMGYQSIASGFVGATLGYGGRATGTASFTIGYGHNNSDKIIASGQGSFAGGSVTLSGSRIEASGQGSFSFGAPNNGNSLASGVSSFAMGKGVESQGDYSFAFGQEVLASGNSSFALGFGNNSRATGELSIGRNGTDYTSNDDINDRLFNIGIGDTNLSRKDAFTVSRSGAAKFHPIAKSTITNASAGMFISNSEESNRLEFYDGTQWNVISMTPA